MEGSGSTTASTGVVNAFPVWLPLTQTWMYNQIKYLPPDVESHVVCEYRENRDQFELPNIHCLNGPRWRRLLDLGIRPRKLAAVVHATGSQVVHSHFGQYGWQNIRAVDRTEAVHVVSFYGFDVTRWPLKHPANPDRMQALFSHVAAVFCEGPVMGQRLVEFGCPRDKIVLQHLGVPLKKLPYRPRAWRRGEELRVLIAAAFREKKGLPYGIRALAELRKHIDLSLTIVGDASSKPGDTEEKNRILAAIRESGLEPHTRMVGFQPYDVLLNEAYDHHVFLAPSITATDGDTEGGAPVSIIEMAATGMAIVSTTHCDIPEVVIDGKTGLLAPERDSKALTDRLEWLIDNPDDWRSLLDAGRSHVEKEFDCVKQGIKLAEHYHRLS